jgi:S-disulfanyl-L-cysteine oxidoreductase SoxD
MATARRVTIALACFCGAIATGERALSAQSPTFGVGRAARPDEIAAIDIDVRPDGRGLPSGSGTAVEGKQVYATRCVTCHGASGREGPQDILVGGRESLLTPKPSKTVGSYWPYATTLWDYVRRAMPFDHPGTLTVDDVYSVTAYVLYLNAILGERDVMDQTTLPKVNMPNRDGFVRDPRPDTGAVKPAARSSRKR